MAEEKVRPFSLFLRLTLMIFINIGVISFMQEQGIHILWQVATGFIIACLINRIGIYLEKAIIKKRRSG